MDLYSNRPDKIAQIDKTIHEDVMPIVYDNIKKATARGDSLPEVSRKAEDLQEQVTTFDTVTNKWKWLERRRNLVVTLALVACGLILLAIVILILAWIFG